MKTTKKSQKSETASTTRESVEELQALVRKHRACWEVLPEQIPVKDDKPLQVGFDLILYGAHAHEDRPIPGCEKCKQIFKDLRKIAQWIIPKVKRPSRYEIEIFDSAIRYDPVRGNRPDVRLSIRILHRLAFDGPIDECQVLCLSEMKAKLSELGAQEGQWKEGG